MAGMIAHRADSFGTHAVASSTDTITLPSGVQPTDIVVVGFGTVTSSPTGSNVITPPSGWTSIATHASQSDGFNELRLYAFVALGSVANLGFANSQIGMKQGWLCSAFSGVDNTTPIDVANAGTSDTGATTLSAGALTIVTTNAWEMAFAADFLGQHFSAAGHTTADNGVSPDSTAALLYDTTPQSTGSTGGIVIGASGSGSGQILTALAFALRPA
jgi:hypothetical protein